MFENISLSFQGIWSHKLRSFLTMLGIIIGIAAIITIVSTIKGTNDQIKASLIGAGSNTVTVELRQGGYSADLEYSALPQGVQVIDDETLAALEEPDSTNWLVEHAVDRPVRLERDETSRLNVLSAEVEEMIAAVHDGHGRCVSV